MTHLKPNTVTMKIFVFMTGTIQIYDGTRK